jgi:DNA invertase Pin-like site-specific DNA recombinase
MRSTQDQNRDLHIEALSKADCKKVFDDTISGSRGARAGLAKALEMLRGGRHAVGSPWPSCEEPGRFDQRTGELHKQGIQFRSLADAIDTRTPSGRFFFHVMASLAEMERELTVECPRAGLEVAHHLGCKGGRKRQMTDNRSCRPGSDWQRRATSRRGEEPWRIRPDAVSLDSGFGESLACFIFRFLR